MPGCLFWFGKFDKEKGFANKIAQKLVNRK